MSTPEDLFLSALYNTVYELYRLLSKSMLRVAWSRDEEAFVRVTLSVLRELMEMVKRKMGR